MDTKIEVMIIHDMDNFFERMDYSMEYWNDGMMEDELREVAAAAFRH